MIDHVQKLIVAALLDVANQLSEEGADDTFADMDLDVATPVGPFVDDLKLEVDRFEPGLGDSISEVNRTLFVISELLQTWGNVSAALTSSGSTAIAARRVFGRALLRALSSSGYHGTVFLLGVMGAIRRDSRVSKNQWEVLPVESKSTLFEMEHQIQLGDGSWVLRNPVAHLQNLVENGNIEEAAEYLEILEIVASRFFRTKGFRTARRYAVPRARSTDDFEALTSGVTILGRGGFGLDVVFGAKTDTGRHIGTRMHTASQTDWPGSGLSLRSSASTAEIYNNSVYAEEGGSGGLSLELEQPFRTSLGKAEEGVIAERWFLRGDIGFEPGRSETQVSAGLRGLKIGAIAGDAFAKAILPRSFDANVDIGLAYHSVTGFGLLGSVSFRQTVDTMFGDMTFGASIDTESVALELSFGAAKDLGVVAATIAGVGFQAALVWPDRGGNFLFFDLSVIEAKAPDGAGFDVNTELLTGGGFLRFDSTRGSYAGALALKLSKLEVSGVGLVQTEGLHYSALVILSAEFPAIQLGFGFTLSGVGGIGGINRRSDPDFFRAGLRSGTLDSIMFPKNVIENASKVVADVAHAFPVAEDNYVFGPMLKMGWGTPKVLSAEIAVILDFPAPLKVLLLGQISMTLPNNKKGSSARTPISVNLDVFGELDITNKFFQLDGVLHDSYVGPYSISGDMAMRMSWGERAEFLLSIGGFHPRFDPPPQIPALQRVRFDVGTGNPRIGAEAYFALTSNTAQVGSRVDVYAKKFGFNASAQAGFDALFVFEPFQFIVDIFLRVAIRRGSRHILSANLDLTLSGPRPWRAKGKVEFRIFFKFKIPFDLTFGSSRAPELPRVDVMTPLITAISDPKNWSTEVATANRNSVVALRDVGPDAERLAHPLSDLSFRQQVLPMQFQFERFGAGVPVDDRGAAVNRIEVNAVELGDTPLAYHPTKEKFAPGEFLELTEDQKLSRPSFEDFAAGAAVIGTRDYVFQERANGKTTVTSVEQTYEQSVIDETTKLPNRAGVTAATSSRMAQALSSMGGDVTGTTGFYRSRPIGISVSPETYVVADKNRVPVPGAPESTHTEAQQFAAVQNLDMADHQIILLHEKAA